MPKKIYCLAEQAFVHSGEKCLDGGGERYLADFVSLLKKLKYEVHLFQYSYKPWAKDFYGHTIVGLGNISNPLRPTDGYLDGYNKFLQLAETNNADGVFFLSLNLCNKAIPFKSLSVHHGLIFDRCEKDEYIKPIEFLDAMKKWIRNTDHVISVDSNGLHIMAAYWPDNIKKMSFIANYYDENIFTPYKKQDNGKFTVLYPRRLDPARGYHNFMQAAEILHEKYGESIEFILCGKGNDREELEVSTWLKGKESYVNWTNLHPNMMYRIYRQADLSVIPTKYAEGSSLSAIESMATGLPLICTNVGGLNDVCINHFNGLTIPPNNTVTLVDAISYCFENPDKMNEMRENAIRMSKAFTKSRWEADVSKVIKKVYGDNI